MRQMPRIGGRRAASIVCLAVLFAAEAASLNRSELAGRWESFFVLGSMPPRQARLLGTMFRFDRALGRFLDGVASATPPNATVALPFASAEGDKPTYAAAYMLAPRRIVDFARLPEASFAAVPSGFRRPAESAPLPPGTAARVPFGVVVRK